MSEAVFKMNLRADVRFVDARPVVAPARLGSKRRPKLVLVLAGLLCVSASLRPAPAMAAEPTPAAKMREKNFARAGWRLVGGKWVRTAATITWPDLVRVRQDGPVVSVIAKPSDAVERLLSGSRLALVEIDRTPFAWRVDVLGRAWLPGSRTEALQALRVQVAGAETPLDERQQVQSLVIDPGGVEIAGGRVVVRKGPGDADVAVLRLATVTFTSTTGQVHVWIGERGADGQTQEIVRVQADNLYDLLRTTGDTLRAEVRPLLRQLSDGKVWLGPGAADVYRAFDAIAPTPLEHDALLETVKQMSAKDPGERDAAPLRLASLGPGGVLAAMRLAPEERTDLDLDPLERLDRYIQSNTAFADVSPQALLADRDFLFDALAFPDRRVNEAARARLKDDFKVEVPANATEHELQTLREQTPKSVLFR